MAQKLPSAVMQRFNEGSTGKGMEGDCGRWNSEEMLGWTVEPSNMGDLYS